MRFLSCNDLLISCEQNSLCKVLISLHRLSLCIVHCQQRREDSATGTWSRAKKALIHQNIIHVELKFVNSSGWSFCIVPNLYHTDCCTFVEQDVQIVTLTRSPWTQPHMLFGQTSVPNKMNQEGTLSSNVLFTPSNSLSKVLISPSHFIQMESGAINETNQV